MSRLSFNLGNPPFVPLAPFERLSQELMGESAEAVYAQMCSRRRRIDSVRLRSAPTVCRTWLEDVLSGQLHKTLPRQWVLSTNIHCN